MRKFTFFLALMVAMVTTTFAQVDYTPKNFTQTTKQNTDRPMTSVVVGNETYALTSTEQNRCYVDKYDEVTFTVTPGQEVSFAVNTTASWIHNAVYIDFDNNGFTAGVTNQWEPTGDLVAYSFYNNGSSSDENGWNSVGQAISGNNRNRPAIPSYTIPEDATPGEYRIRFTQDWCSIDPDGDADGRFKDFYDNRGAILDAKLVVAGVSAGPTEEEITARIAEANEALAPVGVGYPTDAARQVLQEAIAALQAEGTTENYKALATAINTYIATTDVVLPENGKYYTLTMVAKNGNKFYLNYTGEDVAMTARGTEELPESAKYLCEANDNGTVSLKTIDGKYLAYHNKYAGLSWLQNGGNTKGFQDTKDELANITFAKIANGGNVAATNDKQLFGLLSWSGIRGIRTDNGNNENGYMVLKTDGSDYDGASAPFFNDNYSSAFLLEEVEIVKPVEPLEVVSYTPAEAVESLQTITIEFNKDIVVDWGTSNEGTGGTGTIAATDGTGTATGGATAGGTGTTAGVSAIKVKDADGGNVTTIWTSQAVVEGNTITFKLESAIAKSGVYSVEIPAGCIKSVDGEEYAGETFTFTVDAAPALTSKTTVNVDNTLSTITAEFDAEIEFAAESDVTVLNVYVQNTETVAATITVANNAVINGKVLTLTLDEVLAPESTTKYTVEIPAGWIVKKGSDKSFTGKKLTYTVKIPFAIKNFTPASGSTVEALENIVIEYNEKLTTYGTKTVLENVADGTQVEVTVTTNNNVATITPAAEVANGTYKLVNLGYIVSNSSWTAPAALPEYTITVAAPVVELEALEATSTERNPLETAINGQYKLQGVKINFGEVVKKYTTELSGDYGYILDAEGNQVATLNKCMGGNGTSNNYATPYASTAIETPGTYKVVVKSGVILSADGTKEYKGGEFEFTVAERAVEISPSAEEGFCYNETFENVADFSEFVITVKYAKSDVVINNDVKATMKTGETVYEATVSVEKSGNTQYITLAFNGEFSEGRYTIDVPAGLFTVDGTANEAYAKSTFTYALPQLEITRDFDTWESYLDQVWYMPKGAIITIANAESVEVDETKVATITFGENVYNSTLNWYYDNWSNAYYIEYKFEDFFAEGFEFVKGDYIFTLPAGAYTVNGDANEEAVKAYTYGDPIIEEFTVTNVLPASGSTLESIDAISISFSNNAKPDILPVTCGDKTYYFVPMSGVYVPVDLMSYEPIVITEVGTYTLDLSELEGLTGEKVFSWTIAEVEPVALAVVAQTPAADEAVESFSAITFEFNKDIEFIQAAGGTGTGTDGTGGTGTATGGTGTSGPAQFIKLKDANNGVVATYWISAATIEGATVTFVAEMNATISNPGTYTFVIPAGLIKATDGEEYTGGTFTFEVSVPEGIEGVDAEVENDVIYDLSGRRVAEITKAGIYIVNGKKVLVK